MTIELYRTCVPFSVLGKTDLPGLGGHTLPSACTRTWGCARGGTKAGLAHVLHTFIIPTPTHAEHRIFCCTRNLFLCYLKT